MTRRTHDLLIMNALLGDYPQCQGKLERVKGIEPS